MKRFNTLSKILIFLAIISAAAFGGYKLGIKDSRNNLKVDIKPTESSYISSEAEMDEEVSRVKSVGGLVLPKQFFIVAGQTVEIFWRNIVLAHDPETFVYSVDCDCNFASNERRGIVLNPSEKSIGKYDLKINLFNLEGKKLFSQSLKLIVVPAQAGNGQILSMLMVGDSLGHQSRFPNRLAQLFLEPGNPKVNFIGSFKPAGSEILHEQYGGWTFDRFFLLFGEDPKIYHKPRSPFVFGMKNGVPDFDVKRYFNETLKGVYPKNIHIQLGINDGFGLDPQSKDLDKQLDEILKNAAKLIDGFRTNIPNVIITFGSVIQANSSDRAFVESYRNSSQFYSEWRWRQVQMKLARKMIDYAEAPGSGIYLVPTHMTIDPLDGYNAHQWVPEKVDYILSNAVHPSHKGDKQIAVTIYAVIKAEFAGLLSPN